MSEAEIGWDELDALEALGDSRRNQMDEKSRAILLKLAELSEQRFGKCEKWVD